MLTEMDCVGTAHAAVRILHATTKLGRIMNGATESTDLASGASSMSRRLPAVRQMPAGSASLHLGDAS